MSKYALRYSTLFKKQRNLMINRGYDVTPLDDIVVMLANGERPPEKHRDHAFDFIGRVCGGWRGDRTPDLRIANAALSHLS